MDAPTTADLLERYGEPCDDPIDSPTNHDKAAWARVALGAFMHNTASSEPSPPMLTQDWAGTEAADQISDLVADLLILACRVGLDPEQVWERGWRHFEDEIGRGFDR